MANGSVNLALESRTDGAAPNGEGQGAPVEGASLAHYGEITRLIERLHRRYLDVIRLQLSQGGLDDINAVQALLLMNVADAEVSIRELVDRGYYIGSNVTYNVRHLVEAGYATQSRSERDRRSVKIRLTDKGLEVCAVLNEMEQKHMHAMVHVGKSDEDLVAARDALRGLERVWSDSIQF